MKKDVMEKLYEPLGIKERRGVGGKTFKYIASEDVVDRMNKVFAGNWRTEVISEKVIEDQVLVLVRVMVFDQEQRVEYYQEGYASHPILRFTSGINKGKVMDIGNVYRSAMSKAIKTACSKWGVGLYLEEDGGQDFGETSSIIPYPAASTPTTFEPPISAITPTNVPSTPVAETISAPPITSTNVPPIMSAPPITSPVNNAINDDPSTMFSNSNITDTEKITPVQKVAVETVMKANSLNFNELCLSALGRQNDLPTIIEDVSYSDAVKMIQYGNDVNIRSEA